jgi:hypothetical protein
MIKAEAVPVVPPIALLIVAMRVVKREKKMVTLILFIVFTSDDLDQFHKVAVFAGGK